MDVKTNLKPIAISIGLFLIISFAYFFNPLTEGKVIHMGDITHYLGYSNETRTYEEKLDQEILWTNSMFGGMPTYLVKNPDSNFFLRTVHKIFILFNKKPVNYLFLYMLGFFIMLLCFNVNPWLSITGAIAYCFSSYFFIIIAAGHAAKVVTLGYLPPIIGGVYLAYNSRPLLGAIITSIFVALQVLVNHLQISYYTFMIILVFFGFYLYKAIQEKQTKKFIQSSLLLLAAAILAVGLNAKVLWTTIEYGKYSIRGTSELNFNSQDQTSGLDKSYATGWSYGLGETMTLLVPNFKGGASNGGFTEKSESYKILKRSLREDGAKQFLRILPSYWGTQPFTAGPVYIGAIVVFLFIFGLFVVRGPVKWWLLTVTIISIVLSWGHNFSLVTNFMLDHFPGYNKFRVVSMTLIIAQFAMPLLGILAINRLLEGNFDKKELQKNFNYSVGITCGILFLVMALSGSFNYNVPGDTNFANRMIQQYPNLKAVINQVMEVLPQDRRKLLNADAFRSLVLVSCAAGLIIAFITRKINKTVLLAALPVLILIDLWPVNKRYLNDDNFITKKEDRKSFTPSKADSFIQLDKENYRVLNLTGDPFKDSRTSYYHKSIGGYHGAKMQRYQELHDYYMSDEMNNIISALRSNPTQASVGNALAKQPALNMLNTKYIIINPEAQPLINASALGAAWFVPKYQLVKSANTELAALTNPEKADSIAILLGEKSYRTNQIRSFATQYNKNNSDIDLRSKMADAQRELNTVNNKISGYRNFNPAEVAIIDERFASKLDGFTASFDSTASIKMVKYLPFKIEYKANASKDQLAVFSEIYYPKGWNAYIDGEPVEHFRANYVLRAMVIPEGEHNITFEFKPKSYYMGETLANASAIVLILVIAGFIYYEQRLKKQAGKSLA